MQRWRIYVDGMFCQYIRTDSDKGAQYVLNRAKKVWPGRKIEVVATI
jgi:hypothetical protein